MPKSESIDVSPENDDQIEWEFGNLSLSNARNKPLNTQSFWPLLRNDCVLTFIYKQKKMRKLKEKDQRMEAILKMKKNNLKAIDRKRTDTKLAM